MTRLQILELPEGSGDDRPPFLLVVDQLPADDDGAAAIRRDLTGSDVPQLIGARAVLCFESTIDIPANGARAYPDAAVATPHLDDVEEEEGPRCRYCGADCSDGRSWDGGDLYACGTCSDWRAKLNQHKAALLDALGMDRTRDWDDIRNAAAGLRKQRDDQAAELERLRAGEEPDTDEHITPTPGQWIWQWNRATPEKRLDMAKQIFDAMPRANNCFMADHEAQIERLRAEVERLHGTPDA